MLIDVENVPTYGTVICSQCSEDAEAERTRRVLRRVLFHTHRAALTSRKGYNANLSDFTTDGTIASPTLSASLCLLMEGTKEEVGQGVDQLRLQTLT